MSDSKLRSISFISVASWKRRKEEKKEVVFCSHFEEVLARISPFGPYQIFCCIVILYASIEWAGNATFMDTLGSVEPDWNCTLKDGTYERIDSAQSDKCDIIDNQCVNITAIRDDSLEFYSLRAAFALVCNNDHVKDVQIILAAGSLVGALVGGHLGDAFGRMTFFFVAILLLVITSMLVVAAKTWLAFALIMCANAILYGLLETTSLTLMMEYTSNKFRMIHGAVFQWPIAYMVLALIAFLTKDWQTYFVFMNLVACPLAIGFMLFHESPRWLIARNKLDDACNVLNDIAHMRWNNTKARFSELDISNIYSSADPKLHFYHLGYLFNSKRLAKQTFMQTLAVFTYSLVSSTYIYTTNGLHSNAIMYTLLDGVFRFFPPFIIVFLDYRFRDFGRRLQFIISLILEGILFAVVIILVLTGFKYNDTTITILIIVATMINDCVLWLNIIQVTTQRYPTVIRCIAFGFFNAIKHLGAIVAILLLQPLLVSWTAGAFIVPEIFIAVTLLAGFFLQPETKNKALMDQMVEANYGRLENTIPTTLIKLAAGHKVRQMEVREDLKRELKLVEEKMQNGTAPLDSPWVYKGDTRRSSVASSVNIAQDPFMLAASPRMQDIRDGHLHVIPHDNEGFQEDLTDEFQKDFKQELVEKYHAHDGERSRAPSFQSFTSTDTRL